MDEKRIENLEKVGRIGEWEDTGLCVKCSVCGFECDDVYYLGKGKFCPNCGCYMEHGLEKY